MSQGAGTKGLQKVGRGGGADEKAARHKSDGTALVELWSLLMVRRVVRAASAAPATSAIAAVIITHIVSSGIIDATVITHIMGGWVIDPVVITYVMSGWVIDPVVIAHVMSGWVIDPIVVAHVMGSGVIDPIVIPDIVGAGIIYAAGETRQRVIGDAGWTLATLVISGRSPHGLARGEGQGARIQGGVARAGRKRQRREDGESENPARHVEPPRE
jgi:hypothetical protein